MMETKAKSSNWLGSFVNLAVFITALGSIITLQVFWPSENSPLKEKIVLDLAEAVEAEEKEALQL
ncbi:MAG: hypothetical protein F6K24_21560, partial [Okeania sp. SIO2D1]|nr:hypothetical protein [Okeania sp. SIO2D1]